MGCYTGPLFCVVLHIGSTSETVLLEDKPKGIIISVITPKKLEKDKPTCI